jgi:hypothetical protein
MESHFCCTRYKLLNFEYLNEASSNAVDVCFKISVLLNKYINEVNPSVVLELSRA